MQLYHNISTFMWKFFVSDSVQYFSAINIIPTIRVGIIGKTGGLLILLVLQLKHEKPHTNDFMPHYFISYIDRHCPSPDFKITVIIYFTFIHLADTFTQSGHLLVHPHSITAGTGMLLDAVYREPEGAQRTWHHVLIPAWTRRWTKVKR